MMDQKEESISTSLIVNESLVDSIAPSEWTQQEELENPSEQMISMRPSPSSEDDLNQIKNEQLNTNATSSLEVISDAKVNF